MRLTPGQREPGVITRMCAAMRFSDFNACTECIREGEGENCAEQIFFAYMHLETSRYWAIKQRTPQLRVQSGDQKVFEKECRSFFFFISSIGEYHITWSKRNKRRIASRCICAKVLIFFKRHICFILTQRLYNQLTPAFISHANTTREKKKKKN